jgi:hypothetical protein
MENDVKMAEVDFECLADNCQGVVAFKLSDALNDNFQALCPQCHNPYQFDNELTQKLNKLRNLITEIRKAEDILGDCNVAVTVPGKTVKIPYALLLTRLNTMITLNLGGKDIDFHFRVEPSSSETFR